MAKIRALPITSKVAYSAVLILFALHAFVPIQRLLTEWPQTVESNFLSYFQLLPMIPLICFALFLMVEIQPKLWNKLFDYKLWFVLTLLILVVLVPIGIYQDITHTPIHPIFAMWRGASLLLVLFLAIFTFLKNKIDPGRSWLIGVFCASALVGIWEIIYQTANYFLIYEPYFPLSALGHEYTIELPYLITSLVVLGYYTWRLKWKVDWKITIPLGLFITIWITWVSFGYWIEVLFDYTLEQPAWVYNSPTDTFQLLLGRSSKVVLGISLLLFAGGFKGEDSTT